jgi:CRP/FNR family cyclic AMP-dependent transcriptional regulator
MISPERLRKFPHCAEAPDEMLKKVAMISEGRAFKPGEKLFVEGNPADHLMFLEDGEVNILYRLGDQTEVIVDTLVAGDTLAWSALLSPYKLTATGVGRVAGSAIAIKGAELRVLCAENPQYGLQLMTEVARTLRSRLEATRVQLAAKG